MLDRIKKFFGVGQDAAVRASEPQDEFEENLLGSDVETDGGISREGDENNGDTNPLFPDNIYPLELSYMQAAWYRLMHLKYKLQQGARWVFEKVFNTAFYLVAFNIFLALFARTLGFLAAGSLGWAVVTLLPAYIALRSTGPIYDVLAKVVSTVVPPVFSGLSYVVKAIASKVLAHCLRVTGIADYAKTVQPGEFFGKAILPSIPVANRDDEVEPNPDLTTNAAIYGPDLNFGPLTLGTSIRANWSIIKYVKSLPQYIKYGFNWLAKKSGFEDFARDLDTTLKRQEREHAMSDRGIAERELSGFEAYLQNKNTELADLLGNKLQQKINTYVETFPGLQNISKSNIEDAIKLAMEGQQQFIKKAKEAMDAVIHDNAGIVLGMSNIIDNEEQYKNFYNLVPDATKIVDQAMLAKQRIDQAINELSDSIENSKGMFEYIFARDIASKPTKTPMLTAFKSDVESSLSAREAIAPVLNNPNLSESTIGKVATTSAEMEMTPNEVALEEEAKRRLQQEDEASRVGTEQIHVGGRSYEKKRKNSA